MSRILVIGALPESLINFRGDLLVALEASGHQVTAMAAGYDPLVIERLNKMRVGFRQYPVQRNGMNPQKDLQTLFALRKAFRELKPDIVLSYTIKPVIWGGLAAQVSSNIAYFALIEGLGFAFQTGSLRRKLLGAMASTLYKIALFRASRIIFLNIDNRKFFIDRGLIKKSTAAIIDGIGVDLSHYNFSAIPIGSVNFLVIARLLGEKGVREYAQAARMVKEQYPEAVFKLVGPTDPSPDGIPMGEVRCWETKGWIEYHGSTGDVRPFIAKAHIFVHPSYHEGMPRTVLEAMAMGRPILTTDVPGCRETVIPGENGFLVPKADAKVLAERMIWFIEHREEWQHMGQRSRKIAEERFNVHHINRKLIQIMGLSKGSYCEVP